MQEISKTETKRAPQLPGAPRSKNVNSARCVRTCHATVALLYPYVGGATRLLFQTRQRCSTVVRTWYVRIRECVDSVALGRQVLEPLSSLCSILRLRVCQGWNKFKAP